MSHTAGNTTDGLHIYGGVCEAAKERKLKCGANWSSFVDIYWDVSNGGTDIEFTSDSANCVVDRGAAVELQAVTNNGTDCRVVLAKAIALYNDTRYASGVTTHDLSTTTTTVLTLPFTPRGAILMGAVSGAATMAMGVASADAGGSPVTNEGLSDLGAYSAGNWAPSTTVLTFLTSVSNYNQGTPVFGTNTLSLTWAKTGTPTGTATITWMAFR